MENIKPPVAEKIKKELTIHGDTRIDNYYWLNKRDNPKVIDYLKAENEYTKERLKHTEKFQEKLFNEIVGRIKQTDESVPYKNNGYYYYTRYEEGKEYPIYCRKKENLEANEEILINVNEMAKGYSYYQLTGLSVSMDNKLLSFGVDTVSRRKYTIYIKDIETGKIFTEKINNTTGRAVWANDNKTIFYTLKDETLRAYKILKHKLGEDVLNDKELFTETDETYYTYISKTKSNKYLIIKSKSTLSSEYRFLDADNTDGEFKIIQKREKDLEYSISHYKDKFYIVTNFNAKNFRLMETPVCKTDKENWKEIIPHRNDVLIKKIEVFNDYIVVSERENGLIQLKVIELKNNNEYFIDFGEETYEAYISVNYEFETNLLRYKYSSLTTPSSTFDFDMKTKEKKLLKQQEIIGDFNSDNYVSERLYANARDGKKVPISLVYRKGLEKNGNNPLLLYSYGSYGSSVEPYFSSIRLSLLDRGFVYAIAHIRGGQELGREWYEDGKLLNKKNTFTDFIDCAEYLIEQKFTNKSKLFALGGSAGGLLMGVIINMRPDLFKGVVAAVPFVDVVTTMLDEDIPLTTSEYDEWGNPNEKVYYDYMLSYSPYDNVEKMNYPAMLVTTGLHDSQVQYWEPAKWLAKLRDKKTDNNMLLLYTNMEYGHGGASGRFERYKEIALDYAFFLNLLDVNE
ncbi:MAG: S9 family peptidase [Bacteroidales bacterium]|nr:S9 family peptidase [Bacteroidales bacterium]